MKIKTSELAGAALNWAVARCLDLTIHATSRNHLYVFDKDSLTGEDYRIVRFCPSADWAQGGPIIDRERITLRVSTMPGVDWVAFYDVPGQYHAHVREKGSTALVAAMRCFVASKLGDEIDVPEELT